MMIARRLTSLGKFGLGLKPVALPLRAVQQCNLSTATDNAPSTEVHGCSKTRAKAMPRHYHEFPNDVLITAALVGDQEAREERLIREIMAVDDVSWSEANDKFAEIVQCNREGLFLATLPYKVGIASSLILGFGSIPMIFELETALWFNEAYVTTDVPEDRDLETPLEVGSWTWNWMEPPLGQMSFFLLCMQYARAQLGNLGAKPYTASFLKRRAQRLSSTYPQYCATIVESFSEGDPLSSHDTRSTN